MMRRIVIGLATLTGNAYLLVGTVLGSVLALLLCWIPPRGNVFFHLARWWGRGLLAASWVRLRVSGRDRVERSGSYVFMSNHQSLYDIPAMLATLPVQTRFLAKRSLFLIPLFGWALAAGGFISIDRKDRSRAGEAFAAAAERLRGGVSTMIFPEGTRSFDGSLGAFQRGGFLLALKSGNPIVPIGVRGSLAIQKRRTLWIRPGTIELTYGEPIPVEGYGVAGKRELMATVRDRIAELAEPAPD